MVIMISATSTAAISSDVTYLECNDKYYKLTGTYIQTHYNIRSKNLQVTDLKFINIGLII